MMFTRRGNCYRSTCGIPAAHRTFRGLMFRKTSRQLLREHTRNPRHLDLHPHTRHREIFMRQDCCARTPQAHLALSPCAKRHVPAKRLLRSHAASKLGSRSVREEKCSSEKTAAFPRCEHTWISLRAQRDMFMRQTAAFAHHKHTWISLRAQSNMFRQSCFLTPRAHLDLAPCAERHVPSKRLLRSRAAPEIDDFYLRTPHPVSTVKRSHVPYAIGNP